LARVVTPLLTRAMVQRSLFQAVGRPEADMTHIGVAEHIGAAVLTNIFAIMAHQTVTFTGYAALHFACCGEFEALLHTAFGLQLGHFGLLLDVRVKRAWQPF
jgi:hypothetical protein